MRKHHHLYLVQIVFVLASCFTQFNAFSQTHAIEEKVFSFDIGTGMAGYHGDLTEKPMPLKEAGYATSIGISYNLTRRLHPSLIASFSKIGADDKNNSRQALKLRNLNFTSNVFDLNLGLRYYLVRPTIGWLAPYVYAGVGVFKFNPYTTDKEGKKQFLQAWGTEGQRTANSKQAPYRLTEFQVPLGVGFSYAIDNQLQFGLEVLVRKTFTDYLDDVSAFYADPYLLSLQNPALPALAFRSNEISSSATYPNIREARGNPNKMDMYYSTVFKVIYQLYK